MTSPLHSRSKLLHLRLAILNTNVFGILSVVLTPFPAILCQTKLWESRGRWNHRSARYAACTVQLAEVTYPCASSFASDEGWASVECEMQRQILSTKYSHHTRKRNLPNSWTGSLCFNVTLFQVLNVFLNSSGLWLKALNTKSTNKRFELPIYLQLERLLKKRMKGLTRVQWCQAATRFVHPLPRKSVPPLAC